MHHNFIHTKILNMKKVLELLRFVDNFPIEGVRFIDISGLLKSNDAFDQVIKGMTSKIKIQDGTLYAGIESRGFLFSSSMAKESGVGSIMIRKKGKLPPPTESLSYSLEYGNAEIEMARSDYAGQPLIIVDDVLATGGTLLAAEALATKSGYKVLGAVVFIDIKSLHEEDLSFSEEKKIHSLIQL